MYVVDGLKKNKIPYQSSTLLVVVYLNTV